LPPRASASNMKEAKITLLNKARAHRSVFVDHIRSGKFQGANVLVRCHFASG
jgi:hypothetical protein